jgi:carbon monoxide dehydrogenase subunit G
MELTFNIKQPAALVFDYLTDMQKFVSVHPVIYKMDSLGDNNYLVYEKLNMIPFPFNYKVVVEGNKSNNSVCMNAVVMKVVKIKMSYLLTEENGRTQINETISFNTFLPVKTIMGRIFSTQHQKLFMNIENLKK